MKTNRWICGRCRSKAVERAGEGHDGRPRYVCRACGNAYTKGHHGHADDPIPSKVKDR